MKIYPILNHELLIISYENQILLLDTGGSNSLARSAYTHFEGIGLLDTYESKLLSPFVFPIIFNLVKNNLQIEIDGLVGIDILKDFYLMSDLKRGLVGFSKTLTNCAIKPIESSYFKFLTTCMPIINLYINHQKYRCIYDTGAHLGFSINLIENGEKSEILTDFSPLVGTFSTQTYLYNAQMKTNQNDPQIYPLSEIRIGNLDQINVHQAISIPFIGSGVDLIKTQIQMLNANLVMGSALTQAYPMTTIPFNENLKNQPAVGILEEKIHDDFAHYYDDSYDDFFGHYYLTITNRLINDLRSHLKPGQKFLDVGAGTGRISFALQDLCHCTLIEPSLGMLHQAVKKYQAIENLINLPHFYFGVLDEAFEASTQDQFDMIFLGMGVVDYLSDQALAQLQVSARKLLAPQGYLVIQPTPIEYYQDTHLVGTKYERIMHFETSHQSSSEDNALSFDLKHEIKIKSTGTVVIENLKFYQREKSLEKDLSLFKLHKKSHDGSYQTLYFQ